MKRFTFLMLAAVFVIGATAAPQAGAGWFQKKEKPRRTEKPDWMKRPRRYEGTPMAFHSGILQQDGRTGWKLGDTPIQFAPDCLIMTDGSDEGYLDSGRQAIIMGPMIGETIMAWNVRVVQPEFMQKAPDLKGIRLKPSSVNPKVGEMTRAPQ